MVQRVSLVLIATSLAAVASTLASQEPPVFAQAFVWSMDGRGFLGVHVQDMTPELRVHFGAPEEEGVLVSKLETGGPAESAGILVGDIISAVDGQSIQEPGGLMRAIRARKSGESVAVELWRDGAAMTVSVAVAERDRQVMDLAGYRFIPRAGELRKHDFVISRSFDGPLGLHLNRESMEALQEAMRELTEKFESAELQGKLEKLRELDMSEVERRMREVEKRLQELEKELAREGAKKD